ncbi:hypothetical protein CYY_003802 [Polysphondylium violaceum]|uniref:BRCT domain-containing protein n=1 Tax=Polysphondylium violaceum TaxID=133409 RepID=A0A8J4PU68_9MYCE|nr:hypothetical protein CYY_003802 [Polysphondylium violaceum]
MEQQTKSFVGANFYLDLSLGVGYSKKKQIIQFIKDQKGVIDFSCSNKTNYFITTVENIDDSNNYKTLSAIKHGAHVVEELFIFDCLDKNEIQDFTTYRHIVGTNTISNKKISSSFTTTPTTSTAPKLSTYTFTPSSLTSTTATKPLLSNTTTTTTSSIFSSSSLFSSNYKYTPPPPISFNVKPIPTYTPTIAPTFSYTSLLKPVVPISSPVLSSPTIVQPKTSTTIQPKVSKSLSTKEAEEDIASFFAFDLFDDDEDDQEEQESFGGSLDEYQDDEESMSDSFDIFDLFNDDSESTITPTITTLPTTNNKPSQPQPSTTTTTKSNSESQKRKDLLELKKSSRLELLNQKENQKKQLLEQKRVEKELKLLALNAEKEKRIEIERERRKKVLETVKSKVTFVSSNTSSFSSPSFFTLDKQDKDKSGYENNVYLKQVKEEKKRKQKEAKELESLQKAQEKEQRKQAYLDGVEREKQQQELEKQKALEAFLVRKAKREAKALLGEKPVVVEKPDEDLRKIFVGGIDFKDIQENKKLRPKEKLAIQKKRLDSLVKYMNNFGRVQKRNVFENHFFITFEDISSAAKAKSYFENIEHRKIVSTSIKSQLVLLKLNELIAPNHKFYVKIVKSQAQAEKKEVQKERQVQAKIEQDKVDEEIKWESQFDDWDVAK